MSEVSRVRCRLPVDDASVGRPPVGRGGPTALQRQPTTGTSRPGVRFGSGAGPHRTTERPGHGARTFRWGVHGPTRRVDTAPRIRCRPGSPTPWPRSALAAAAGVTSRSAACRSCSSDALAAVPDRTPAAWRRNTVCSPRGNPPATARAPSTGNPASPRCLKTIRRCLGHFGWRVARSSGRRNIARPRQSSMAQGRTRSNRSTHTAGLPGRLSRNGDTPGGSNVRLHRVCGAAPGTVFPRRPMRE